LCYNYHINHNAYGNCPEKKEKAKMAKDTIIEVTSEDKVVAIDILIANEINPRKINRKAYEALKKSLQEFPDMKQLRPIVVDENMTVLGGHQRIYALKDLGYADVLVKQVFGLTEKQKREFIIKDNTASGEWDTDILANNWEMEELEGWGLTNFNFGDVDKEPKDPASKDDQSKEHICPGCGLEFED
jgi:ParB-like chromosome segregation protein Spo0J